MRPEDAWVQFDLDTIRLAITTWVMGASGFEGDDATVIRIGAMDNELSASSPLVDTYERLESEAGTILTRLVVDTGSIRFYSGAGVIQVNHCALATKPGERVIDEFHWT